MGRDFQTGLEKVLLEYYPWYTLVLFLLYILGTLPEVSILYYVGYSLALYPTLILMRFLTCNAPRR